MKSQCLEALMIIIFYFFPFHLQGVGGHISLVLMIVIHDQR